METLQKLTRKQKIEQGLPKPFAGMRRKKVVAEARKEARRTQYIARLNGESSSPRKMRLVADLVRGADVQLALAQLQVTNRAAARPLRKLLLSALAGYQEKTGQSADQANLYIKTLTVDSATMLKRIKPAPQGRAYRVRKRSNHITLTLAVREDATPSTKA